MPYLRDLPRSEDIPVELIDKLPINFARQRLVLPLGRDGSGRVMVAVADPHAVDVIDAVAVLLGRAGRAGRRGERQDRRPHQQDLHAPARRRRARGERQEGRRGASEEFQSEELVDMLDANDEAPIIRWVNSLMFQAAKEGASDIHIRPGEKDIVVRYRVDGVLREAKRAPKKFQQSIIARVKIMAGLNIAEKRLPQDGRIRRKMAGKDVDMRVATAPTAAGESVTIRLLDRIERAPRPRRHRLRDRSPRDDPRASSSGRTASCSSPARPAPARRPRSTRASPRSTRPTSTSSPSRIRSSTSSRASRRRRSTRRSI